MISPDDLAELEETLDVLSDPESLADFREADAAYVKGDVVRGADAVRDLLRWAQGRARSWSSAHLRSCGSDRTARGGRGSSHRVHDRPTRRDSRSVGKMLRRELHGIWSAKRGTYRVRYRINDNTKELVVLRIDHRWDVYH